MSPEKKSGPTWGLLLLSNLLALGCHAADDGGAQQLVVTATRSARAEFEVPQAINVVTRAMLQEANVANLPDALAGQAGVLIQKSNTGGGSPFIRGLTGKQVLILVDGVRVNNSYFRFGPHQYLNTLALGDIGRVEVVHGPASVLYGSDALGGVINIITRRNDYAGGSASSAAEFSLRTASADASFAGRARFAHAQGDLSLSGGVGVKRFGDLRGGDGVGRQVPTGYDESSLQFKAAYRLAAAQELVFVQQILRQADVPKTNEVVLGSKAKFNYEPQLRAMSYLEYAAADLPWPVADSLRLNLSFNRQKEGEEIIERATPTLETRELTVIDTVGLTGQAGLQLGDAHRLTYGFEHYRDRYDTRKRRLDLAAGTEAALNPGTPDGARYTTSGLYLQDEMRLGDDAQLIAGVRHAHVKAEGQVLGRALDLSSSKRTASLMGLYRLSPRLNLVGTLAQGYRAPNMEDFFGRVDFVSEIPNPALRPETSLSREIGLKYHDGASAFSLHYHVSTYRDLISRVTVSPGVRQRQNQRRAEIQGLEASASHAVDRQWSLRAALASSRGEDLDTGKPLQRMPPVNGSLQLRYAAGASWWADLGLLFALRQDRLSPEDLTDPRIPAGGTPGYSVVHVGAGWRPVPGHELVLTLENLADARYKTHGSGVYGAGRGLVLSYQLAL